jgi:hypothetical protein
MLAGNPTEETPMPQILVVTSPPEETASSVVYRERVATSDLQSDHFAGQLVERVAWAVEDADQLEREDGEPAAPPSADQVRT